MEIPLVTSEIAGLWNSYMGESLAVCVLKFFTNRVEDSETRAILQSTLDLSNQHLVNLHSKITQEIRAIIALLILIV